MEKKGSDESSKIANEDNTQQGEMEGVEDSASVADSTSTTMSSPSRRHLMMAVNNSLQSLDPLSLLKPVQQAIHCTGDDTQSSFAIYGNEVTIFPCQYDESHKTASNKVRISQVCKYDWEQRYYFGELVASNKTYVAYVVGVKSSKHEQVRVINHTTSSRVLLKGFEGKVTSIIFGGPHDNHLACMDMVGNIHVFLLSEEGGDLKFKQVVGFTRKDIHMTEFSLVAWAPSMLDDESDDEGGHELILAITLNEKVEVLSLERILKEHDDSCILEDITTGKKTIENGHTQPITQLVISPNYEALATCSLDGFVKVWSISFDKEEEEPRCLHEWKPHDGEPVTALIFCDNHLAQEESISSWRFLITGAKYNSEIKVWCSVSWKCLQTLRFCANPQSPTSEERNPYPRLKPVLDKSASFFILSDIKRQVLYVLQLFQDAQEGTAHFTSLTECILTQPMLSFSLYQSKAIKKSEDGNEDADEDDDKDVGDLDQNGMHDVNDDHDDHAATDISVDASKNAYQVSLKMFGIHDKSLQKLHVRYTPSCSVNPPTPSVCTAVSSEDQMSVRDAMSDITEGQGSVLSDHEDTDSFATANLKVSSIGESVKSSTSTLTTISVGQSSLAVENDQPNEGDDVWSCKEVFGDTTKESLAGKNDDQIDAAEKRLDVKNIDSIAKDTSEKGAVMQTQKDELVQGESPMDEATSRESSMRESLPEESLSKESPLRELPVDELPSRGTRPKESFSKDSSARTTPGTITILKRTEKVNQNARESSEDSAKAGSADLKSKDKKSQKKKVSDSEVARQQLMAELGVSSPKRSATPSETIDERGKGNGHFDDYGDFSLLSSASKSSSLVETDDLLGLDINTVPGEEKKPLHQDSSQPTGLILKMLQDQQKNILQLTKTVQDLSIKLHEQVKMNETLNKQQHEERESTKSALQLMQKNMNTNLNKMSKEVSKTCSQRIDTLLSTLQPNVLQTFDNQLQAMFQGINANVGTKLEKAVKSEFKATVTPNMNKLVNALMEQVSNHVSTRLIAIEKVLREDVSAMVKSKGVAESIGFNAATVIERILPNAYRDAFTNVLIPSYERSCSEMFVQISKEFEKGTKNYFQKLDGYFESRKQRQSESRDPAFKQMQDLGKTFQDTADRLTGIEVNLEILMQKQISDAMHKLKSELITSLERRISDSLLGSIKETLNAFLNEMKNNFAASVQGASARPLEHEMTPESRQRQIDQYLLEYDYSKAFENALNAEELAFVLYVCQRVDSEELFSKKDCCLSQPIILSLIQQLSVDLTEQTELKVNYLSEAIEALDEQHEIAAAYMPTVLDNLAEQVEKAIIILKSSSEPDKQHQQQLNMLRKLIRAKCK